MSKNAKPVKFYVSYDLTTRYTINITAKSKQQAVEILQNNPNCFQPWTSTTGGYEKVKAETHSEYFPTKG